MFISEKLVSAMIKKIFISLILFFNIFVLNSGCFASDLNDNNILIPSVAPNTQKEEVQDIINKTQQLQSKVESDRNALKGLSDQKKADYLEARKNFINADKQLKAVRSINKKFQKSF